MQDALRLKVSWHTGGIEGAAQLAAVVNAVMAVGAGLARHVLVYRTVTESTEQGAGGRQGIGLGGGGGGGGKAPRMGGSMQWSIPFRAYSAANWLALNCQRHMHEYGTTTDQLAMIAVNARRNAVINPKAVYRDPMTLDDYYASRMITTPFRLFDCDAPVDGSTAVIVSAVEHAAERRPPGRPRRGGGHRAAGPPVVGPVRRLHHDGRPRRRRPPLGRAPTSSPADVDVAELYDGFSFLAMTWLEALGFCGKGESGPVHRGRAPHRPRRRAARSTPTAASCRPAGSTASASSTRPCLQLRGEAGDRQVPEGRRGGGGRQRRRPDRRRPAPHEARLMAFDQDDAGRLPRPHRGRARRRRGPEPRHRVPPGLRRADPRPGPHGRRRRRRPTSR